MCNFGDYSGLVVTSEEQKAELEIGGRCLAVFVDDTGHEAFKGQPFYGLGGCAALGRDIDHIVYQPWRELRRRVTGSPDSQLHASEFGRIAKPGDVEAVAEFFRAQPFFRFGAVMTHQTILVPELSLMRTMKGVLRNRINDIVEQTLCKQVYVVFESSHRVDKLLQESFGDFEFCRGSKRIPSECFFMPKSAADPALEVADFIVHAVGRQARYNLTSPGTFLRDFRAVFHAVQDRLTSFMEVQAVIPQTVGPPGTVAPPEAHPSHPFTLP
jgi:hypothetical protein